MKKLGLNIVVTLASIAFLISCSDDIATSSSGASTSASAATSTGVGGDGGDGGASSSDASSTADAGSTSSTGAMMTGYHTGFVSVFSGASSSVSLHGHQVSAGFHSSTDGAFGTFDSVVHGDCVAKVYSTPDVIGTQVRESAGAITIAGGDVGVTLTPDAMTKKYAKVNDVTTDLFVGGETIDVTAEGDATPPFSLQVVAPVSVDITAPAEPPPNAPLPIDRTNDIVFTWNNGGAGHVVALFNDGVSTIMTCTFASAAGTGTVPKEALALLPPNATGLFVIESVEIQLSQVGEWTIQTMVGNALTWNGVHNPQTLSFETVD